MPVLHRQAAAGLALLALSALALQFRVEWLELGEAASTGRVLWVMARYFTILTNALVVAVFGLAAWRARWPAAAWPAAVTVWIVATGGVYHALLAAANTPAGLEVWSDIGLHSAVPLASLALWWLAAPKSPLGWYLPLIWTGYPLGYAIYAILRGLVDGRFPYFFLDPAKSGVGTVIAYVLGLGVFFVASGSLLIALARTTRPVPLQKV
jgi:hypothetical protein